MRLAEVDNLWQDLFAANGIPRLCPLIYQHVTSRLYVDLIKNHFSYEGDTSNIEAPPITTDEENIIQYAAEYVPFKLLKKHEKCSSVEAVQFVECLTSMAVNGEESDLMQYTRNWTCLINRGGQFEINDTTYLLFREIELNVRKHLFLTLQQQTCMVASSDKRDSIISAVASDDNVQFHWTFLSVDIESEDQAVNLLKEIVGLWLTIRGFSIAGTWIEYYLKDSLTKESKKGKASAKSIKSKASPKSRNTKDKASYNTKGLQKQLKQKYASL